MNIKYLFVVSCTLFFLFISKNAIAQTINIDQISVDPYIDEEYDDSNPSIYGSNENQQIGTANRQTLQNATPRRGIYTDDFLYRWYVQGGIGGQMLFSEDDSKGSLTSRFTIAPSLTGGYRWNPIFGIRLQLTGGSLHGYNDGHSGTYRFWKGKSDAFKENFAKENGLSHIENLDRWDPQWNYKGWTINNRGVWDGTSNDQIYYDQRTTPAGYNWIPGTDDKLRAVNNQLYMQHVRYVAANAAVTMNLFPLFGGADDSRKFDMSLHLGPTFFHVFPHLGTSAYNGFGVNAGLQGTYHVSDKIGVFAEFNGSLLPDGFDGHMGGTEFDLVGQAMLGVTYKFPMQLFDRPTILPPARPGEVTSDMSDELDRIRAELMAEMGLMVDLQPEIDRLREQLAALSRPQQVIEVEVEPDYEPFFLPQSVHFAIGKTDIDAQGMAAISEVATYLRSNPGATVIITGYADKGTGTDAINERLSRERSKKVADALVYRHNIDMGRVAIDWQGDSIQPFFQNQLNRAVLFYIEY